MSLEKKRQSHPSQLVSRGEQKYSALNVTATAYTSKCKGCTGFTFTEHDVRNTIYYNGLRIIASDNSVIPLYSIVRVETKNESFHAIVLDRGSGIDGLEIDLLVKTTDEAMEFGRQNVKISIIRKGRGK